MAIAVFLVISTSHYFQNSFENLLKKIHETPENYRNIIKASPIQYSSDSLFLSRVIKQMAVEKIIKLDKNRSVILIDTIIYDSTYNKLTFWVLCQTPNPDTKISTYLYSGNGYYAFRNSLTESLSISSYMEIVNKKPSYNEIRAFLRNKYLYETAHKGKKKQKAAYNWDDSRLWTSPVWDSVSNNVSYTLSNSDKIAVNPSPVSILVKQKAVKAKKQFPVVAPIVIHKVVQPVNKQNTIQPLSKRNTSQLVANQTSKKLIKSVINHKVHQPILKKKTKKLTNKKKLLKHKAKKKSAHHIKKKKLQPVKKKKHLQKTHYNVKKE